MNYAMNLVLAAVLTHSVSSLAAACPFCQAIKNTLSEELAAVDAAVIAKLTSAEKLDANLTATGGASAKARFEIIEVLKGQKLVGERKSLETVFFGEPVPGKLFMVVGVDPVNLQWATPLAISERAYAYLKKLPTLPKEGADRLAYFQEFFEDADALLAADAYDEFAKAPYATVRDLKPKMHREKLAAWVQDENIQVGHRRLYFTLLGVCGTAADVPALETMLKDANRKYKGGLDALIACYLNLKGPAGLELVDELFLKNKNAEYADTYAAIMALRFHVSESDVLPKERVLVSFHHMLERPLLADLVIPDLARMDDWAVAGRLVSLFKEATDKNSWVRVPVVNYMRACPLPEAKQYLKDLEQIDPQAVKRANTFFPVTPKAEAPKSSRHKTATENLEDLEAAALAASASNPLPPPDVEEMAHGAAPRLGAAAAPVLALGQAGVREATSTSGAWRVSLALAAAITFLALVWSVVRGGAVPAKA